MEGKHYLISHFYFLYFLKLIIFLEIRMFQLALNSDLFSINFKKGSQFRCMLSKL